MITAWWFFNSMIECGSNPKFLTAESKRFELTRTIRTERKRVKFFYWSPNFDIRFGYDGMS